MNKTANEQAFFVIIKRRNIINLFEYLIKKVI
jgi:hypothetical protein